MRDVDLKRLRGRLGRLGVPERLDQLVSGDDAVRVQREQGQQGALLGAAEVDR